MIKHQLFIGAALLAGVAVGYFVREHGTTNAAEIVVENAQGEKRAIVDKGAEATIAALRARVAELEAAMTNNDMQASENLATSSNVVAEVAHRDERRRDPREWLERIKKENPERYVEMTNRWAQFRAERKVRNRTNLDMIASVDTSKMSVEAKENHLRYQELMIKREELEERMQNSFENESITDEQRQAMFREMGELSHELRETAQNERANLLVEMSRSLGFSGDDATEIAETVSDIIEATDQSMFRRPGRGGGNRRSGMRGANQ